MRVLIDVNHPAHVHLFRCAAVEWMAAGDVVMFAATAKDVTQSLLDAYKLPHETIYTRQSGVINLARELVLRTGKLVNLARKFKPDVILSLGSPTAAWASTVLRKPHVAFEDTEDSIGQIWLYQPFTRAICVPEAFTRDFGERMVRYAGYHELAYLHPRRFMPDPARIAPLKSNERFFVVRFVGWDATHDDGESGLSHEGREALFDLLRAFGRVVLSEERKPPVLLDDGHVFGADAMHHLLAYADMYIGEGVTAASEAACLGTASILINTRTLGYISEQQNKYQLVYHIGDEEEALAKVERMLLQDDLKNVWQCRRDRLLDEKIDVTGWIDQFVREMVSEA
jgi:predicted glycosyltransferase